MRRFGQPSDNRQTGGGKRNILNNAAYSIFTSRETNTSQNAYRNGGSGSFKTQRLNSNSSTRESSFLQRSVSADNVVVRQRGFKPSDRHDPAKRNILENLTSKILHFDMESRNTTPINLQKLLTPASDSSEVLQTKNRKMYASSYFYAPTHPTVEDQVELARRISNSLSDVKNVKSKGQSMYVNRKKRSVKWIHDGNGKEEEEDTTNQHKDKVPLKCMMNPNGKVLDIHGIQALGEEVNIQPEPPEKLFDIVRDLNNHKGRGAEIFAKRRKRSEKWVVDTSEPSSPTCFGFGQEPTYPTKQEIIENVNFDNKPFYNTCPVDIPMDYSTPPVTNFAPHQRHSSRRASFSSAHSDCGGCGHSDVKKIYLREVAVGTDPSEQLSNKQRRGSHDGPRRSCGPSLSNGCHGNGRSGRSKSNGYQHPRGNGYHGHHMNGFSYITGQSRNVGPYNGHHPAYQPQTKGHHHQKNGHHPQTNGYQNENGYQNGTSYYDWNAYSNGNGHQNGKGCPNSNGYQNGHGYQNSNGHQNGNGYENGNGYQNGNSHQNGNGYQNGDGYQNGNGYHQHNDDIEEVGENPEEDYTPVPVKQLIQEFEKTIRPVMQYKQYVPNRAAPPSHSQGDISRYFESRREVAFHQHHPRRPSGDQRNHYQNSGNGYACSSGDDEDDDDDDDESLDDSLSPVDLYRVDERRIICQNSGNPPGNNRSSSMSTLDEYYRRQLLQQTNGQLASGIDEGGKIGDPEAEVPAESKAAALAAIAAKEDIVEKKKCLKNTPVLENLVAGTTTPECFKKEYSVEVANKVIDKAYHGPKISSYQTLTNYNTAPRGWDSSQPVYRPIRFEKPQDVKISYSDF